jgi:MFS family permease
MSSIAAAPEAPWPRPSQAWWTVAVLVLTAGLCTMDKLVLTLVIDMVKHDLGMSETQMGLLQGLSFNLLFSIAGIPLGLMADRVSRRRLLMGGVVLWSLATFAGGLSANFGQFFVARMLVGAGEAALWPVAVSMIGELLPPDRRGRAISATLMGQIVGSSIGLYAGGHLLGYVMAGGLAHTPVLAGRAPWRVILMVWGLLGLIAAVALMTATEPPRRGQRVALQLDKLLHPFFGFARNNLVKLAPLWGAAFFVGVGIQALTAWTGAFYLRHFHMTPAKLGPILGVLGITSGVVGTVLAGFVSDKAEGLGRREGKLTLMIVAMTCALPISVISLAPSLPVALGLNVLSSICYPIMGVLAYIIVQDVYPNELRGLGTAVHGIIGSLLGGSVGPLLVALITQHVFADDAKVGYSMGLVVGPSLVLAALCAAAIRRAISLPAR